MCIDKLKVALKFLEGNRNGIRNKTILLFFLSYGMERRKLCALSDGAVNTILSGIVKTDVNDRFYNQLTPGNIRRCLVKFLLQHDYPLQKISYLMDMDSYKLGSYITQEDIEKTFWAESKEPVICKVGQHPMERFLEQLREPSEGCAEEAEVH